MLALEAREAALFIRLGASRSSSNMRTMRSVINGWSCTRSQSALPEDWNISTLDCISLSYIHGNLKSKNILLDRNLIPYLSDCCLHLLLNPYTGQEMLEAAAAQGFKAPELVKMRDCNEETDVYSLLLEILTGNEECDTRSQNIIFVSSGHPSQQMQ